MSLKEKYYLSRDKMFGVAVGVISSMGVVMVQGMSPAVRYTAIPMLAILAVFTCIEREEGEEEEE